MIRLLSGRPDGPGVVKRRLQTLHLNHQTTAAGEGEFDLSGRRLRPRMKTDIEKGENIVDASGQRLRADIQQSPVSGSKEGAGRPAPTEND